MCDRIGNLPLADGKALRCRRPATRRITFRLDILVLSALLWLGLSSGTADAHDLERTQVLITFARDGSFVVDVANDPEWLLLRLERFLGGSLEPPVSADARDARLRQLASVFVDRVVLLVDGREITPTGEYVAPPSASINNPPARATYRLRGRVPSDARTLRWFYGLATDPYPLTIRRGDGRATTEWINAQDWSDIVDLTGIGRRPRWHVVLDYLVLGYTHILPKGVDHILFVIGIFLLSTSVRPILIQVTTFTVAHSITLGLTMYGIVSLSPRVVEPLIALSIVYVAVENLVTTELKPWRLTLVFSFGLLHGMGFADALRHLGLPRSEFLTGLVTFNLGVECGQLTVIAMASLCVLWYRQRDWYRHLIVVPASIVIAGVGLYWTVARVL